MRLLVRLLSLLPLKVLYALMQAVVYPLVYYVVGYRKDLVRRNLSSSFPEKTSAELRQLEKQFYHYFADLLAEIIYGYRMTDEEWLQRVVIDNREEVEPLVVEHGGAVAMLGHFGCWEWLAGYATGSTSPLIDMHVVYQKQTSASADRLMKEMREKHHCKAVEVRQLLRHMVGHKGDGRCHLYGILADQKPHSKALDFWVPFLHHDTPFITGTEKLARRTDYPVFYVSMQMPSRGHYVCHLQLLAEHPTTLPEHQITAEYARLLETDILRTPHIWLWTHNRFKWKRG